MSGLGSLAQCMMDSDPEALKRSRNLRRKALVISVFIEALVIAALLLWPLITPGVGPRAYEFTSLPPFPGVPAENAARPRAATPNPAASNLVLLNPIPNQPPQIPAHMSDAADAAPPALDAGGPGIGENLPGGPGWGQSILGANGLGILPVVPPPIRKKPLMMSEGVMQAALIHRVEPVFPEIARISHRSGTVRLRAIIGTDGSIRQLEVMGGDLLFAPSALVAVRQWRYQPTRLDGQPVEVETYITVNFVFE